LTARKWTDSDGDCNAAADDEHCDDADNAGCCDAAGADSSRTHGADWKSDDAASHYDADGHWYAGFDDAPWPDDESCVLPLYLFSFLD
jgi:hypothetical protein